MSYQAFYFAVDSLLFPASWEDWRKSGAETRGCAVGEAGRRSECRGPHCLGPPGELGVEEEMRCCRSKESLGDWRVGAAGA